MAYILLRVQYLHTYAIQIAKFYHFCSFAFVHYMYMYNVMYMYMCTTASLWIAHTTKYGRAIYMGQSERWEVPENVCVVY